MMADRSVGEKSLATTSMRSLWHPLWRSQDISHQTNLWISRASMLSVLLYVSKMWPMVKSIVKQIDGFKSQCLQTIERISWKEHVTNEEVRARTLQDWANVLVKKSHLRWYGHLLCCPPDHPSLQCQKFSPAEISWMMLEASWDAMARHDQSRHHRKET